MTDDVTRPPFGGQPYLPPVPPETDASAAAQLPPEVSSFVGRADELRFLTRELAKQTADRAKVLAIYGQPGVGKSTLAVHFAHQVKDRYQDAQLYVNLRAAPAAASLTDEDRAGEILADLLRALGVKGEAVPRSVSGMSSEFRSLLARKSVLILLDDFESEDLIAPLIPASASSLVIVTSRRSMPQLTETRLRLEVLDPKTALDLLATSAGGTKIEDEPGAAKELVDMSGRLPLAIKILGARLAGRRSVRSLVDHLREGEPNTLKEVAGDAKLARSFSLSYEQLTATQQQLFRRLSVFTGPHFDHAAAASLVAADRSDVAASLEQLAGLSLLEPINHLDDCYQFHRLLREYAAEHFRTDEDESDQRACRLAVLEYYVAELANADRRLQPTRSTPARVVDATDPAHGELNGALGWLTRERDNLVAGVTEALRLHELDLACQLATNLASFFEVRAHYLDWQQTHEAVLADPDIDDPELRADKAILKRSLGKLCYFQHRWDEATDNYQEALDLFLALGLDREVGVTLLYLGDAHRYERDWDLARNYLTASLQRLKAVGFRRGEAIALRSLGAVCRLTGAYPEAIELYNQALGILKEIGDERWIAATNLSIGDIYVDQKDSAHARPILEECLRIFEEYDDRHWKALTLRSLGEACRLEGDYRAAQNYLDRALEIMRDDGDTHWEAATIEDLGELHAARGEWQEAIGCYGECIDMLTRGNRDKLVEARARKNLGIALYRSDDIDGALKEWHLAWHSYVQQNAQEADEVLGLIYNGL